MFAFLWAMAGFIAGVAVATFASRTWRGRQYARAIGAAALLVTLCFGIYRWADSTRASPEVSTAASAPHAVAGSGAAGSLEEAAEKLAAKLAAGNGSDADWELLARSYEFLGDSAGAQLAQQHRLKIGALNRVAWQSNAAEPSSQASP